MQSLVSNNSVQAQSIPHHSSYAGFTPETMNQATGLSALALNYTKLCPQTSAHLISVNSQLFLLSRNNHTVISVHTDIHGKGTGGSASVPCIGPGVTGVTSYRLHTNPAGLGFQNPNHIILKVEQHLKGKICVCFMDLFQRDNWSKLTRLPVQS